MPKVIVFKIQYDTSGEASATLGLNLYYKGHGKDREARQALRNFIAVKYPQLSKFSLRETGAGFEFASGLRDIGYEMKVKNVPILAGSLIRRNCMRKTHRINSKFKFDVNVVSVSP